jgi:predicted glycosyltransferase
MGNNMARIWIDLANPSHPHFFNAILSELKKIHQIQITARERGETVNLALQLNMNPTIFGSHPENSIHKSLAILFRIIQLNRFVEDFDYALSLENVMSVIYAKRKNKISILFLDNDLKYKIKGGVIHNYESKKKLKSDYIILPAVCADTISKFVKKSKIISYNGYKEDIYIADYKPDYGVKEKIPFEKFVVVRPEALGSFYVNRGKSIMPDLLKIFEKNGINIVYLPRDKSNLNYVKNYNVFIPKKTLNGLDLCYFSSAVLTGSGTLAREAACMGKTAVSFFPNDEFLSVDQHLIEEGKLFHSREPKEICNYVISNMSKNNNLNFKRSKTVKDEVLKIINKII